MTALITGGAGFLGINLAKRLSARGERVRILDLHEPPEKPRNVRFLRSDITDFAAVSDACRGVSVVYNLASMLPVTRAGGYFWKVNVQGTENVLRAAVQNRVRKVVHLSSSIVYGIPEKVPLDEMSRTQPLGDYGKSKLAAEGKCTEYMDRLDITILRPRLILGPGRLGLLTILFDWVSRGKKVYLIGSGRNRFQMVGVQDLVDACLLAAAKKAAKGQVFNIGADNVVTVHGLLSGLVRHAGSSSRIVPVHAGLARNALRLLDCLRLTPLNAEHYFIADKDYVLSTEKAKRLLGWRPKQGMQEMMNAAYDWYMRNKGTITEAGPSDFPEQRLLKLLRLFS